MTYPTMKYEVLEAIQEYYKDDEAIEVDCLLYLAETGDEDMAHTARKKLVRMGYCPSCGEPLVLYEYKEWHNEVDPPYSETMLEYVCPCCDLGDIE